MTFLFVDRITAIDSDRARGDLCRAEPDTLPAWLVIEAIGQLAGWIAAARSDFTSRPVAALVGEVHMTGAAVAGPITLEAQLDRVDGRAVLYSGCARSGDTVAAALSRCVGPILPIELFDDPVAVRGRFDALRSATAPRRTLSPGDLPRPDLRDIACDGTSARALLQVPEAAAFFAEHFPRRPVFPATLLAEAKHQLGRRPAAAELGVAEAEVEPTHIADLKVRAFSPPGQLLELTAVSRAQVGGSVAVVVTAHAEGKRISTCTIGYRTQRAVR